MKLSDLVRREGYEFKVVRHLDRLERALGDYHPELESRAYRTRYRTLLDFAHRRPQYGIACHEDCLSLVYSASHEIAELHCGFSGHTADLFCEQANLLSRWLGWAVEGILQELQEKEPRRNTGP